MSGLLLMAPMVSPLAIADAPPHATFRSHGTLRVGAERRVPRFTFDPLTSASTSVGGTGYAYFELSSTYTQTMTVTISVAGCTGSVVATSCQAYPTSIDVDPDQTVTVSIQFTAGSSPGTASVSAQASGAGYTLTKTNYITVSGVPHATVTAGAASGLYVGQGGSTTFTITSDGSAPAMVTPSVSGCSGAITGCSQPQSWYTTLAVGQSMPVTVSYSSGSAPGTGTATLSAINADNGQTFGSASASVPVSYAPVTISATPSPSSLDLIAGDQRTVNYSVVNTSSYPAYLSISQKQCDLGSCGAIQNPLPYPLGAGQSGTVSVQYSATTAGNGGMALSFVNAQAGGELAAPVVPVTVHAQLVAATLSPPTTGVYLPPGQSGSWAFQLKNTGNVSRTISLTTVECSGGLVTSSCVPSPGSATLAAGATTTINVAYQTSQLGSATDGYVRVNAIDQSTGTFLNQGAIWVSVPPPPAGAVAISMANINAGTNVERSACLSMPAGNDADNQCGDLRITHPLPATRTFGTVRVPTLLYNSQTAQPTPQLFVDVTLPVDQYTTSGLSAVLIDTDNSTTLASGSWPVTGWPAGATRRIMMAFDGRNYATRIYHYRLEVTRSSNGPAATNSTTGAFALVNRSGGTIFPAGWWLAGLEQLYPQSDGSILWVGGDGSTRQYLPTQGGCPQSFVATAYTRPDTLLKDCPTGAFTRLLSTRATVSFDASGHQTSVTNRQGRSTTYQWQGNLLLSISLPVASGPALQYTFQYLSGVVQRIVAPPAGGVSRETVINSSSNRVANITDPDGTVQSYTYDSYGARVNDLADRLNHHTHYAYSAGGTAGSKLTRTSSLLTVSDSVTWSYSPQALMAASGVLPIVPDSAYTTVDGPRSDVSDVTRFQLDRFGAPTRITNALAQSTDITRDDNRFPGLATIVRTTSGYETRTVFDPQGHVSASISVNPRGDGVSDTTHYTWDAKWDAVTTIVQPMGETTTIGIEATTGNRLWQQIGDASRRVTFAYYTSGPFVNMLQSTHLPTGEQDEYHYDGVLGNLSLTRTPMGFTTLILGDGAGRDTLTLTPIDAAHADSAGTLATGVRNRTRYDAAGRVAEQWTQSLAVPGTADSLAETVHVATNYDGEGRTTSVQRNITPDPNSLGTIGDAWYFDALGRDTLQAGAAGTVSRRYDAGGNVVWTSHGDSSVYDALNRRTRHLLPAVNAILNGPGWTYENPNGAAADVEEFEYDVAGNLIRADNGYAQVRRTYYANGALRGDTAHVRAYGGTQFDTTPIGYEYDRDGRLTKIHHTMLGPTAVVSYSYDPLTGVLNQVQDPENHFFSYVYDVSGRLQTVTFPMDYVDHYNYDADSRLSSRGGTEVLTRDARGKIVSRTDGTAAGAYTYRYSALGNLRALENAIGTSNARTEYYTPDALGNPHTVEITDLGAAPFSSDPTTQWIRAFDMGSGTFAGAQRYITDPLSWQGYQPDNESSYDGFGNLIVEHNYAYTERPNGPNCGANCNQPVTDVTTRYSWYDANNHLRFLMASTTSPYWSGDSVKTVTTEYEYDALGRRVLARYRGPYSCHLENKPECRSTLDRQYWVGDQLLAETRTMEDGYSGTVGPGFDGSVVYTHGPGIDEPLAMRRESSLCQFTVFPHTNFLGRLADGSFDGISPTCAQVDWAGSASFAYRNNSTYAKNAPWNGSLADLSGDATGLQYMRNRYYNPASGQFTQADPLGVGGGLNVYGYAGGDPVSYADPFGLAPCAAAQLEHGWKDVKTMDGVEECQSDKGAAPVVVTAKRSEGGDAWWYWMQMKEEIQAGDPMFQHMVPAAVPAWMGGPAAGELTAERIIARFKKGSINQVFPGEMRAKTFNEIEELAKSGNRAAKTAYKLLKEIRFNK